MKRILFISILLVFFACHKEDEHPDRSAPVVTIQALVQSQVFQIGDTIHFEIDFVDASLLKSISIQIKDSKGIVLWQPASVIQPNSNSYHYSGVFINNIGVSTSAIFSVDACDQFDNAVQKAISIQFVGTPSVINASDYSIALLYYCEIVHVLDISANTGMYGTCANVSIKDQNASNSDTLIVDFGTTNCLDTYGRYKRGKIICIYDGPYNDSLTTKQISFSNYFVNNIQINGTAFITNNGRNAYGNTWYAYTSNGSMILPFGGIVTITNNVALALTAGQFTPNLLDDTWSIYGTSLGTNQYGTDYSVSNTLFTPVNRNLSCSWFSQGTLSFTPQGQPIQTIDFGNGDCDYRAAIIIGTTTYTYFLQ